MRRREVALTPIKAPCVTRCDEQQSVPCPPRSPPVRSTSKTRTHRRSLGSQPRISGCSSASSSTRTNRECLARLGGGGAGRLCADEAGRRWLAQGRLLQEKQLPGFPSSICVGQADAGVMWATGSAQASHESFNPYHTNTRSSTPTRHKGSDVQAGCSKQSEPNHARQVSALGDSWRGRCLGQLAAVSYDVIAMWSVRKLVNETVPAPGYRCHRCPTRCCTRCCRHVSLHCSSHPAAGARAARW